MNSRNIKKTFQDDDDDDERMQCSAVQWTMLPYLCLYTYRLQSNNVMFCISYLFYHLKLKRLIVESAVHCGHFLFCCPYSNAVRAEIAENRRTIEKVKRNGIKIVVECRMQQMNKNMVFVFVIIQINL